MAKKDEPRPQSKSKMTFIMFQLDGGDETLQESFKTIGQALQNSFQHAKALPPKQLQPAAGLPEREVEAQIVEEADEEEGQNGQEPTVSSSSSSSSRTNRPPPRSPNVLDLKLTEGNPPLKAFLEQKKPGDEHTKKYLVIAYWLKHNLDINEVTMDHIHTGYRHMQWNTPKDAGAPLRKMRKVQQWFNKGSGEGLYAINHIGENVVNSMGGSAS